jgi:ABC-type uncharacterized transport system involved in gliding motility auxiliary subunit
MEVRMNPRPQDLMAQIEPTGERYVDRRAHFGPGEDGVPRGAAGRARDRRTMSRGPINVVVMADSDIFDDRFWVHVENLYGKKMAAPFADNAAFVLNAVENLTGSSDLISLRTRATNDRPFTSCRRCRRKPRRNSSRKPTRCSSR